MSCVVLLIGRNIPVYTDYALVAKVAKEHKAQLLGYYVQPVNLQHYGEVDHLVPAGTADDFIQYVKQLDQANAEVAFTSARTFLHNCGMDISIQVLYEDGEQSVAERIRSLGKKDVFVFPESISAGAL